MIPSNPSTDNGSQVNQMTCQFTTGFSEKQQLCFQRPKLQEHLWGRFSSSAPWKIGNAWKTFFSFAFGGQRSLFMGICIYIYSLNLGLGLGILSQRLWLCSMSTVSPSDVAIHALVSKSLQPEVQQQSWQSTTIVRLGFLVPKSYIFTNGDLEVGSWMVERFDVFFLFPSCFLLFYHFLLVSWIVEDSKCCSYPFFGDEANIKVSESLKCWKKKLGT